jgi:hypothetical protein
MNNDTICSWWIMILVYGSDDENYGGMIIKQCRKFVSLNLYYLEINLRFFY